MEDKEILLEEWKDVRETLRHLGSKRFAQLTVFLVANGAMMNAFLNKSFSASRVGLAVFGVLLSGLFLVMEVSSRRYIDALVARGKAIEASLPVIQFMSAYRPEPRGAKKLITGTYATYILYGLVSALWLGWFIRELQR